MPIVLHANCPPCQLSFMPIVRMPIVRMPIVLAPSQMYINREIKYYLILKIRNCILKIKYYTTLDTTSIMTDSC